VVGWIIGGAVFGLAAVGGTVYLVKRSKTEELKAVQRDERVADYKRSGLYVENLGFITPSYKREMADLEKRRAAGEDVSRVLGNAPGGIVMQVL
jgi:hypothetical protein